MEAKRALQPLHPARVGYADELQGEQLVSFEDFSLPEGIFDESRFRLALLVALKMALRDERRDYGESDGDNEQTEQQHHASGIWKDRFIPRRDTMHVSRCRETTSR